LTFVRLGIYRTIMLSVYEGHRVSRISHEWGSHEGTHKGCPYREMAGWKVMSAGPSPRAGHAAPPPIHGSLRCWCDAFHGPDSWR